MAPTAQPDRGTAELMLTLPFIHLYTTLMHTVSKAAPMWGSTDPGVIIAINNNTGSCNSSTDMIAFSGAVSCCFAELKNSEIAHSTDQNDDNYDLMEQRR